MRLALIGTFYGRHENTLPLMRRIFVESTRIPDEVWLLGETVEDCDQIARALETVFLEGEVPFERIRLQHLQTPRDQNGRYAVIPYSNKINHALERSSADAFVYLDNGSMPHPEKFRIMAEYLEWSFGAGACYCTQHRTGFRDDLSVADRVVEDAYCALNYTQVMHRATDARWTLDMRHADPDMADAIFWRELHKRLGAFYPVSPEIVLDEHHISSPKAVGLDG